MIPLKNDGHERLRERLLVAELAIWAEDYEYAERLLRSIVRPAFLKEPVLAKRKGKKDQTPRRDPNILFLPKSIEDWARFAAEHRLRQVWQKRPNPDRVWTAPSDEAELRWAVREVGNARFSVAGFYTQVSSESFRALASACMEKFGARENEGTQAHPRSDLEHPTVKIFCLSWAMRTQTMKASFHLLKPGIIQGELCFHDYGPNDSFPEEGAALLRKLQKTLTGLSK